MVNLAPLAAFVSAIAGLYSAIAVYRAIYPYDRVREALELIAEYRLLLRAGGKRAAKRARQLEPRVRAARRLVLKAMIVKTVLVAVVFVATMTLAFRAAVAPAPFSLPPLSASVQVNGDTVVVAYIPIIHFLGYIYALLLFRDAML